MEVLHERCGGLDVHKKTVTACVVTPEGKETRTFGTVTRQLLALGDWLIQKGCTHVAMESTGPYWKPIFNLLEDRDIEVLVVNARDVKNVPGRKTDVKDAEWIADLLRHGLLRGSYIPDRDQRELRELTRYRKDLVQERAREVNRIQKVLEGANIKLGDVATDVLGKSGRTMLRALIDGEDDSEKLASLARGRLRSKKEQLQEALQGIMGAHQRMILKTQLDHIEYLEEQIEQLNREIEQRMRPFEEAIQRLDEIPGIGRRVAEEVLAEIGLYVKERFPTAAHLASWCGLCPGNNESAGKRLSGRTRHGNPHVRSALVEAAHSAARTRDTYYRAQYRRIAARRGAKRAAVAVAHSILVTIYHMLSNNESYRELGATFFEERNREATARRAVEQLQRCGFDVRSRDKINHVRSRGRMT